MPQVPIIMPQLGEAIAEATIIGFLAKVGDVVEADQDVVEVETNKASMNVSSPARGKVIEWAARRDESYAVGEVLGHLEVTAEEAVRLLLR
jgi:pyruvate/2-oxoglutarate dehydrogenase complex dihydrolipoamide acyltransferase (E2) component